MLILAIVIAYIWMRSTNRLGPITAPDGLLPGLNGVLGGNGKASSPRRAGSGDGGSAGGSKAARFAGAAVTRAGAWRERQRDKWRLGWEQGREQAAERNARWAEVIERDRREHPDDQRSPWRRYRDRHELERDLRGTANTADGPRPENPAVPDATGPYDKCGKCKTGTMRPVPGEVPHYDEGDGSAMVGTRCDTPGCGVESYHGWAMSDEEYRREFGHNFGDEYPEDAASFKPAGSDGATLVEPRGCDYVTVHDRHHETCGRPTVGKWHEQDDERFCAAHMGDPAAAEAMSICPRCFASADYNLDECGDCGHKLAARSNETPTTPGPPEPASTTTNGRTTPVTAPTDTVPTGEAANIELTRIQLDALSSMAISAGQAAEQMAAGLSSANAGPADLEDVANVLEASQNLDAACRAARIGINNRHAAVEEAVLAAPHAAETDWYKH